MVIGWFAMLTFAFHASTHMVAAGDTWVAMACGRHFVNHGVDTVEPFSANAHEAGPTEAEVTRWPPWARWITDKVGIETVRYWHPTGWVNQNWLTHILFYRLTTALGSEEEPYFDALIWWKFAIYFIVAGCLYATSRLLGINRLLAVVFVCFAMFIGRSFLDVRPAGFSNLLVAVFLLILALTTYRNVLYIWLIVPVIVFWSNVHGGYLYAFIALVPFVAWHVLMRLPKRWTVAVYSILTWTVLSALAHRFLQHDYFQSVTPAKDWVFYLLILAVGASIALTACRQIGNGGVIAFHASVSGILFLLFLTRFFPLMPLNLNSYGRQVYAEYVGGARVAFIGLFGFAVVFGAVVASVKDRVAHVMEWRGIFHMLGAVAVAFVAMVIFNPFHLTNLTHTYVISLSKNAERWRDVHEWHRAFDWRNPVGTAMPFMVMYAFGWLVLIAWSAASVCMTGLTKPAPRKQGIAGELAWPRLDLALVVIAALTTYMAIRSRRFIPIAAFAACPILALLTQQVVTYIATLTSARRRGATLGDRLEPTVTQGIVLGLGGALLVLAIWRILFWHWLFLPVPGERQLVQPRFWLATIGIVLAFLAFPVAAALVVGRRKATAAAPEAAGWQVYWRPAATVAFLLLASSSVGFGLWVAATFKRVYLDYWPADPELTSVFMRMTASDAKPFDACRFIRDNELSGNMFNYWTEGGFIAWGQTPDPNTGRTPLQLFMDGRAQAAYDRRVFDLWSRIIAGGDPAERAAAAGRTGSELTKEDFTAIGDWVASELAKYDVWAILMPSGQFRTPFVRGLDYSLDWQIAFVNNKQRLYVNIETPKGRRLYDDVIAGRAVFPDEFSADFTRGHDFLSLAGEETRRQGLEMLIKAFEANPSVGPLLDALNLADQLPQLRPRVTEVCQAYVDRFQQNKAEYARTDGYNLRIAAASYALSHLSRMARAQGDTAKAAALAEQIDRYQDESFRVANTKRW